MINKEKTSKALLKNTGIIAIGQISAKVITFLMLPLYTALLTKEEYGSLDLLVGYATVLSVIIGLQLYQGVFRFLATDRTDEIRKKQIFTTAFLAVVALLLLFTTGFCLLSRFFTLSGKWFLLFYVIALIFHYFMTGSARGLGNNAAYAAGNFVSAVLIVVLNVVMLTFLGYGLQAMFISYIVGPVAGGILTFVLCKAWRLFDLRSISPPLLKELLQYCIPLVPNELSWSVLHTSDRIIVSKILGVGANGLVAVDGKLSTIYNTIFSIFNIAWIEQVMVNYELEGGKEYIGEMFEKMVVFFGTMAIGLIAVMPFAFPLFVNDRFQDAYLLLPLYFAAVFFSVIIGMLSAVYLVEKETKQIAISTFYAAVVNVLVDLCFIRMIGIWAAPISSICGYASVAVWRLWDVNRRHLKMGISMRKLLSLFLLAGCALWGYYCGNYYVAAASLLVVFLSSVMINREMLKDIFRMLTR